MQLKSWRAICLLLLLTACSEPSDTDLHAGTKVYRHAMDGAPASLEPAQASSIYANFLVVNLYDTLYRYKYLARPYELEPNLADGMPEVSEDGLTLTIRLKKGARFIDDPAFAGGGGRAVTAADFVYSIKRHFDPSTRAHGAWLWQGRIRGLDEWKERGPDYNRDVAGLVALDDHTVRIELITAYPQFVHTLAQGYAAIVPREAVEAYGRQLGSHPVGSGPFKLVNFDSARAIMEKNPGFRKESFSLEKEGYDEAEHSGLGLETLEGRSPPFIDRLEVEFIAENAARWNAFASGQLHFIKVPATQFDRVLANRDSLEISSEFKDRYRLEAALESGFVYTNFNLSDDSIGYHPDPVQNQRNRALRCAVVKGFDWQARNESLFYGIGRVFPGIIPPTSPEFDAAASQDYIEHDPEGAKRLLREHGWTAENLPVLEYGFPSTVTERQGFEQFRSLMVEIGYPVKKIRPLTFASYGDYAKAYGQREVMLITSSWTMDYPDAENTIQLYYGPNASPGSNSSNFNHPGFNALYERAAPMQESPERTRLYREMNRLVIEECATISGLSRTMLLLWDRHAIMKPDRSFIGGYYLRFVDILDDLSE